MFKSEFYGGSRLLTPVADAIGLQIDQINFLVCQLIALGVAFPFRNYLSVEKVGARTRHMVETVVGVFLTLYCFGYQIWHLLAQSLVSYACMAYGGKRFSHGLVFVWSMLYLAGCHVYRQIYDYGGYTMDITGPLMIQTQRLTSLAFALHDGLYKDPEKLSQDQKSHAVKKLPSMLQYLSFMFYFHGIMVGPLTFYNDYIAFIDGSSLLKPIGSNTVVPKKNPTDDLDKVVIRKLMVAAACCMGMMILPGLFFPPEKLNTPEFYSMSYMKKMIFILGVMTLSKFKYYFAWTLADAINNAAGHGFNGYDDQGNPKWDLTDNVDILGVEMSTSLKVNIGSWNKTTTVWLRRVVYERAPRAWSTLAVFATSAFWHGFYPGYYFTFGGGAFFTIVARQVRRHVRPRFQESPSMRLTYDAITFVATRFANAYLCFPFLVLEFYSCIFMYKSVYFSYHLLTLLAFNLFSFLPTPSTGNKASRPGHQPSSSARGSHDSSSGTKSADNSSRTSSQLDDDGPGRNRRSSDSPSILSASPDRASRKSERSASPVRNASQASQRSVSPSKAPPRLSWQDEDQEVTHRSASAQEDKTPSTSERMMSGISEAVMSGISDGLSGNFQIGMPGNSEETTSVVNSKTKRSVSSKSKTSVSSKSKTSGTSEAKQD